MTILTKQSACDEKVPVKIAIPPEQSSQTPQQHHEEEGEVPLNNNNTIIYAHYQQRKRRTLLVLLMGLIMSLSLFLFMSTLYEPKPRQEVFLQKFRCEVGEDGVPHFQEITGDNSKDGSYFPFSVRVFRIWLPNLFEMNNSTDNDNDELNSDLLKADAFFGGSQPDDDLETSDSDRSNLFREELSFNNHDTEQILTVDFLDFKNGKSGRFIHALTSNQTAIVDKTNNRCFVMPLDPDTNIIPEDILNMSNDKDLNTERVRKNMEIVTPRLEDLSELSPRIQKQCGGMNTYKLEKHNSELFKRDASPVARYSELAGNKWIDLNIVGVDRLDHIE